MRRKKTVASKAGIDVTCKTLETSYWQPERSNDPEERRAERAEKLLQEQLEKGVKYIERLAQLQVGAMKDIVDVICRVHTTTSRNARR